MQWYRVPRSYKDTCIHAYTYILYDKKKTSNINVSTSSRMSKFDSGLPSIVDSSNISKRANFCLVPIWSSLLVVLLPSFNGFVSINCERRSCITLSVNPCNIARASSCIFRYFVKLKIQSNRRKKLKNLLWSTCAILRTVWRIV